MKLEGQSFRHRPESKTDIMDTGFRNLGRVIILKHRVMTDKGVFDVRLFF